MSKKINLRPKPTTPKIVSPTVNIGLGRTTVKPTNLKPPKTK